MTLSRRRFLTVAASFAALPSLARADSWEGRAFGAEASITLQGPSAETRSALTEAQRLIREVERQFSLYDRQSDLSRLNAAGRHVVPKEFVALMRLADTAHRLTEGRFDPTVQPLWQALASGGDLRAARAKLGWDRVDRLGVRVRLNPGQALTFNGIAQGFATDLVANMLHGRGFTQTLINIGEYRGTGGPWQLGLADPVHGLIAQRTLTDGAIATSSPSATPIGPSGHIVHGTYAPHWSTVSVEADTAAMADALSTGLVLGDLALARRVRTAKGVRRITLIDTAGDLITL